MLVLFLLWSQSRYAILNIAVYAPRRRFVTTDTLQTPSDNFQRYGTGSEFGTSTLSANFVNEARFGMSHNKTDTLPAWLHPDAATRTEAETFLLSGGVNAENVSGGVYSDSRQLRVCRQRLHSHGPIADRQCHATLQLGRHAELDDRKANLASNCAFRGRMVTTFSAHDRPGSDADLLL